MRVPAIPDTIPRFDRPNMQTAQSSPSSLSWGLLSRHRGPLMGLAILSVMLFHVYCPRTSPLFGLWRMGNIGVDVFLFVSGIGLWYAWSGNPQTWSFLRRRFVRIYPTWLLVAGWFYISAWIKGAGRSTDIVNLIGDITINIDFWRHDELTFWYMPAIMALYLVAPLLLRLLSRDSAWSVLVVVAVVWCFAVAWVRPVHNAVGHIEIFWSRIPIFIAGLAVGRLVKADRSLGRDGLAVCLVAVVPALLTGYWLEQNLYGRFPLFVMRMLFIPMTVFGSLLVARVLDRAPAHAVRALSWIGGISLEVYLLHSQFILPHLTGLRLGYWPTAVLLIVLSLPAGWLLQRLVAPVGRLLERCLSSHGSSH